MFGLFGQNQDAISVKETQELLQSGQPPKLLDVREKREWDGGRIPGAVLASPAELANVVKSLDKTTPIICYCHSGMRSLGAVSNLKRMGFSNVRSMSGGIVAWANSAGPVTR